MIAIREKQIQEFSAQLNKERDSLETLRQKRTDLMNSCSYHTKKIHQLELQAAAFESNKSMPSHM